MCATEVEGGRCTVLEERICVCLSVHLRCKVVAPTRPNIATESLAQRRLSIATCP